MESTKVLLELGGDFRKVAVCKTNMQKTDYIHVTTNN